MKKTRTHSPAFRFFFLDRTFGTLALLLILVAGFMAYQGLVKESFPDIDMPMAYVSVIWPGASPELVEKKITLPLETQISSIEGVKEYESTSATGGSMMWVRFEEGRSIESAIQELRSVVGSAAGAFPKDAETPNVEQASFSTIPIVTFTLYGDVDELVLDKIARKLKDQFMTIKGVKNVEVSGNRREIVKILLNPSRIAALGISPTTVMTAISSTDIFSPVGTFEHRDVNSYVKLDARVRELKTLRSLPVLRQSNGRVVRLGEVATIRRELEDANVHASVSFNGSEFGNTVNITLYKSPGFDTIDIVNKAETIVEETRNAAGWPHQLQYQAVSNKAEEIGKELSKVISNAGQSMLVVFCILLFMLTWRESLVAGLSIPLTFLGTFAVLWGLGYTLNTLTFIGLIIAVGLLVDDFILVMEGMHEARSQGLSLIQAQIATIKTYAVPSFSGSLTTILAFLPVLTIKGFVGQFMRSIPIATVTCLALSYLISILIDVPLSSYIYRGKAATAARPGRIDRLSQRASERLGVWLRQYTVRNKWIAAVWLAFTIALFGLSLLAYKQIPRSLNTRRDNITLGMTLELAQGSSLDESREVARHVGEQLRQLRYFENIEQYVGMRSPLAQGTSDENDRLGPHLIAFTCKFLPEEEREKKSYEYLTEIRQIVSTALREFPAVNFLLHEPKQHESYDAAIAIEIYGPAMRVARRLANEVTQALSRIPGAVDVRTGLRKVSTDWRIEPDREALDFYQISTADLNAQLGLFFGTVRIGKLVSADTEDELDMFLGMAWPSQAGRLGGPSTWPELDRIHVINAQGKRLHLSSIATIHSEDAPIAIERRNGRTSVTVLGNTEERQTSEIFDEFLPQLREMQQTWPTGYGFSIGGEMGEIDELVQSFKRAFVFAVLLIFSTLALIFRSFRQTLIIIFSIPFALTGTFLGFFLCDMVFSVDAAVGIVSLAGIAVNDAIVLIDTMNQYRRQGLSIKDAAARGAGDRLRPVLSTSLTTILGLVPLALSDPEWAPLCYAIIFGLMASTLITLYVIPALYLLFTPKRRSAAEAECDAMLEEGAMPAEG